MTEEKGTGRCCDKLMTEKLSTDGREIASTSMYIGTIEYLGT